MATVNNTSPVMGVMGDRAERIKQVTAGTEQQLKIVTDRVEVNNKKLNALDTLKNLVKSYQDSAASIADPINNPFLNNKASVTTNDVVTTNYLNITTGAGTPAGSFNIRVDQVATASTMVFDMPITYHYDSTLTGGGPVGLTGTFTVTVGGVPSNITVAPTDSVIQIAQNINSQFTTNGTNAQAIAIISGATAYIEIRNQAMGNVALAASWATGDGDGYVPVPVVTLGQGAIIHVEGIEVQQNSNIFSNVIQGMTITALAPNAADPTKNQTVTIVNDPEQILVGLTKFTDAHTALTRFVSKMTERLPSKTGDRNQHNPYADTAVLHDAPEIRQAKVLLNQLSNGFVNNSGQYSTLAQVGLGFVPDSSQDAQAGLEILDIVDRAKLNNAILNNFADFTKLFRGGGGVVNNVANQGSSLAGIYVSELMPSNVLNTNIAVAITVGIGGAVVLNGITATIPGVPPIVCNGTYVPNGSGAINFVGTPLEGLNLIFTPNHAANTTENFTVNFTQGLADVAFFNSTDLRSDIDLGVKELKDKVFIINRDKQKVEEKLQKQTQKIEQSYDKIAAMGKFNDIMLDMLANVINPPS